MLWNPSGTRLVTGDKVIEQLLNSVRSGCSEQMARKNFLPR